MRGLHLGLGLYTTPLSMSFSPADVAGLVLDLNPDVGYVAGASWADQSTAGNNVTLTGTSAGTAVNGHPTVAFTASDSGSVAAFSTAGGTALTMIVAIKADAGSNFEIALTYNIANNHSLYSNWVGTGPVYVNANPTTTPAGSIGGAWHRIAATDAGVGTNSIQAYQDNVAQGAANGSHAIADGWPLAIGGSPFVGTIARILIYNRVLSASELTQVDDYLTGTYGI